MCSVLINTPDINLSKILTIKTVFWIKELRVLQKEFIIFINVLDAKYKKS